jgi:hypothetical protein
LERKLERMEEKENSPEVSLSVMANHMEIASTMQDEQQPSEQLHSEELRVQMSE